MLSFMIRSTRVGLQLYSYSAENFLIFTYTHESLQGRGSHFTPRITLKTKKKKNPGPRKRKRKNYPEDTKKEESCTQKRRAILQQKEKSND
jgi:hypothetical protein